MRAFHGAIPAPVVTMVYRSDRTLLKQERWRIGQLAIRSHGPGLVIEVRPLAPDQWILKPMPINEGGAYAYA